MNDFQDESNRFHREYYASHELYEAGTWLEKPNGSVMEIGQLLANRTGVRALDLGAGVGRNCIPFVKLCESSGIMCDCVEVLPEAVEKLRRNASSEGVADRINPICSDIADYQIAAAAYDMVMAMSALEHAYDTERIRDGIRMIQDGTRINGYNCLSIATDLKETDAMTGQPVEVLTRARLSADECRSVLSSVYEGWDVQRLDFSPFQDTFIRDGRTIEWTARYCLFVARKIP
jgi:cyclopropane fatty-acyl-phospholipid synthase-like methyltransferase